MKQKNEKHMEERLDHKNFQEFIKHRYQLVAESKKQANKIFLNEQLGIKVIMNCTTTSAHKFRARLGFKQDDVILTKEQSILTKIISSFEGENIQTKYKVFSYRIHLYFLYYKLAIEIDKNGHSDRNIDNKIKRQKVMQQ